MKCACDFLIRVVVLCGGILSVLRVALDCSQLITNALIINVYLTKPWMFDAYQKPS